MEPPQTEGQVAGTSSHEPKHQRRSKSKSSRKRTGDSSKKKSSRKHGISSEQKKGKTVGDYVLATSMGKRGAQGQVFQAMNKKDGGFAAVKVIPIKNISEAALKPIMEEIKLLKMLTHPNIMGYIGMETSKSHLYIILEYLESGSVFDIMRKYGNLAENVASKYAQQILRGLKYIHRQGVIHRDIKAANILTTKAGSIKIGDFGLAMQEDAAASGGEGGGVDDVAGTPYWMAPEVIQLTGATAAADIWAVGCTVIEFVTGKPPYFDMEPMAALFRIVQDSSLPIPPGMSSELEDFLRKCMVKDPSLRANADELLEHKWILKFQDGGRKADEEDDDDFGDLEFEGDVSLKPKSVTERVALNDFADDDDFDDFEKPSGGGPQLLKLQLKPASAKTEPIPRGSGKDESDEEDDSAFIDGFDIKGDSLASVLKSKMSSNLGAGEDEEDVFKDIDDIPRKGALQNQRMEDNVHTKVNDLSSSVTVESALFYIRQLLGIMKENPRMRQALITHHGVVPLVEILTAYVESPLVSEVLGFVNEITGEKAVLENLCLVGGIPAMLAFAPKEHKVEIRLETARFLYTLCSSSTFSLQMIIGCNGFLILPSLLDLEFDKDEDLEIARLAVSSVARVFSMKTTTPKNTFCRLLAREGIPEALSRAFVAVVKSGDEEMLGVVSTIWYTLCQGDEVVRESLSKKSVISGLFECIKVSEAASPLNYSSLLNTVRLLSVDSVSHTTFSKTGVIAYLVSVLGMSDREDAKDIQNQALTSLFNICRVDKDHRAAAAKHGIVPPLVHFVKTNSSHRQFAIRLLCDIAHTSYYGRYQLMKEGVLPLFLSLLDDSFWSANAMESLSQLVKEEKGKAAAFLALPESVAKITVFLSKCTPSSFGNVIGYFLSMTAASTIVSRAFGEENLFVSTLLQNLSHTEAHVRVQVLKVIINLYRNAANCKALFLEHDLSGEIEKIKDDESQLVQHWASVLSEAIKRIILF